MMIQTIEQTTVKNSLIATSATVRTLIGRAVRGNAYLDSAIEEHTRLAARLARRLTELTTTPR